MRRPAIALALALLATPAAAQQQVYVRPAPPAWLGISYETLWIQRDGTCRPQVVVDAVVQGSPAERAGLRGGDAIISLDGEPVPAGRLEALAARLAPGDSVRLRVRRGGTIRELTAVADRRPDRPLSIFVESSSARRASSAPVIEVTGDTLVARNLAGWSTGSTRSYWMSWGDGRTELRSLRSWSHTDLDRRVVDLLACADSARSQVQLGADSTATTRVDLRRLQQRADSLRVVITRRALQREQGGNAFTFELREQPGLGLRGVAGAELTALVPELAEYFRNADQGLLVLRIAPESPARRAGLRPGDVIVAADGRRLDSVAELQQILALPDAGPVELRVIRRGRTRDITLQRE